MALHKELKFLSDLALAARLTVLDNKSAGVVLQSYNVVKTDVEKVLESQPIGSPVTCYFVIENEDLQFMERAVLRALLEATGFTVHMEHCLQEGYRLKKNGDMNESLLGLWSTVNVAVLWFPGAAN
jgi:hypothetical protein